MKARGPGDRLPTWQPAARLLASLPGLLATGAWPREARADVPAPPVPARAGEAASLPAPRPADSPGRRLSPRSDAVFVSVWQIYQDELASRDVRAGLAAPLVRGDGGALVALAKYGATWIDGSGPPPSDLRLHRFELMLGGGVRLAPGWSLRGAVGEAHGSDLRTSGSDAFQLTVAASVSHLASESDAWGAGVAYSQASPFLPLLPTLSFVHHAAGSPFRFDALLPRHVRVTYQLSSRTTGTVGLETHGDKWLTRGTQRGLVARRSGGAVFVELGLALTSLLRLEARLGFSVDSYRLPDPLTDTEHRRPLQASSFAQLIATVTP